MSRQSNKKNNDNQNEDLLSPESLAKAQENNLNFIEDVTKQSLSVSGVPVLNTLSYEFIQILNNMYLQDILGDSGENNQYYEERINNELAEKEVQQ